MKTLLQLKKNLKNDASGMKAVKVALLGDTATQFLVQALRGEGIDRGLNLQIFEAGYNQIEHQVFNEGSELYRFKPEIVIIYKSSQALLRKYNSLKSEEYCKLSDIQLELADNIYKLIVSKLNARVIFYNFPELDDTVFGNYSNKIEFSFLYQLRKLNYELMKYASCHSDFYLCDISSVQNQYGRSTFFQSSLYVNYDMVLSVDILPIVAARTLDIIAALNGKLKKCLILDLDNTLWGGIIGDDGLENIQIGRLGIGKAFTELQEWIKKLKDRGIILAVCSKNTESIAKEPFEKHPEMVLRLEDIAVFIANWESKINNIRQIKSILNIGFDSMVFLDDNPFERNLVREHIPEVLVPELPDDPANYLEYLYSLNLFETVSFSNEDVRRTRQYQIEARRYEMKKSFTNENEYLKSLNMLSQVRPFDKFNIPRVAQLTQRTNQFNLRTIRYTEEDIRSFADSDEYMTFTFTLEDKFGDNGLISIVILKKTDKKSLFIDTWLMSCRVIKRGVENFVLNNIVRYVKKSGFTYILGEYIETSKNGLVKDHYKNLGFKKKDDFWILNVTDFWERECYINEKNGQEQK